MMSVSVIVVELAGVVREELAENQRLRLETELKEIFQKLHPSDPPHSVFIPRTFSGYSKEHDSKLIVAAEVTCLNRYERHILKIGDRDRVEQDYLGWQECTSRKSVNSRIFAPVRKIDLSNDRVAVLYDDAFSLFGPDVFHEADSSPRPLENMISEGVLKDFPDLLSIERAIAAIFTDLALWFYRGSEASPKRAWQFFAKHLRLKDRNAPEVEIFSQWESNDSRALLRRHAVWVLCGRDVADADPVDKPARYLDPLDFIRWAMEKNEGELLPDILVGRGHGDLHPRNVLVAVRRGEVQYPSVFDYGDMGQHNVLAWDFAKLETELKVRLLPQILNDESTFQFLIERSGLRNVRRDICPIKSVASLAKRADRLAAFLAFEELLDEQMSSFSDSQLAEQLKIITPAPTSIPQLDRLLSIVLRVRREAANWLGFKMPKRLSLWKDELYFALGIYGLMNVRWDYTEQQQESAIVSSGVALARMPRVPKILKGLIEAESQNDQLAPSYRIALAHSYVHWKSKNYVTGCEIVQNLVLEVQRDAKNQVSRFSVNPSARHAVPLICQAMLLQLEVGQYRPVEALLETVLAEARSFQDFEMLARIGRALKQIGDRLSDSVLNDANHTSALSPLNAPSHIMYERAFAYYSEAFEFSDDWYVGINAATLALLSGKKEKAEQIASHVVEICAQKLCTAEKNERYWLYATQGEAALIMDWNAEGYYELALGELSSDQGGMADSSYKQACRLWRCLGQETEGRVARVLRLFETSEARDFLTQGFLGRNSSLSSKHLK